MQVSRIKSFLQRKGLHGTRQFAANIDYQYGFENIKLVVFLTGVRCSDATSTVYKLLGT